MGCLRLQARHCGSGLLQQNSVLSGEIEIQYFLKVDVQKFDPELKW